MIPNQGHADVKLFFLGPLGTYSHQAATKFDSNQEASASPAESICQAVSVSVERIQTGQPTIAILPVENSYLGVVQECLDCLASPSQFSPKGLTIVDEVDIAVAHALIVTPEAVAMEDPYSHIQEALGQCAQFLDQHIPHAKRIELHSTAEAVQKLSMSQQSTMAAIGSEISADLFHLPILARSIQALRDNVTRFIVAAGPYNDTQVQAFLAHLHSASNPTSGRMRALFRVQVPVESYPDIEAACATFTQVLSQGSSLPWTLYGKVHYRDPSFGSTFSGQTFAFEMESPPMSCTYEAFDMSEAPLHALRAALNVPGDSTLECLGLWPVPPL